MIEPVSAATLGGLAYDAAKTAITKWVGVRISAGIDAALRDHQLKHGRPAKDQQAELAAVITSAVERTAAELFPDQDRLRDRFQKDLLQGRQQDWPLVNGTDLTHLVSDVHCWITRNDPQPAAHKDANDGVAHPYLSVLCRNIIAQFGFRAENNGTKNTILYPRWNRFWTTELFTNLQQLSAPSPAATGFRNDFHAPVSAVIQAHEVTVDTSPTPTSPDWPRLLGTIPPLAAAHQDRPVDQDLTAGANHNGTPVICQILSGMGGVGKTQIAAGYAHRRWNQREVDLLLWVNAATRQTIMASFAQAGAEICGADPSDGDRAALAFLSWIARPDSARWLIVLDDLADPADLSNLWPPAVLHGHTIITTRRRDAALDGHGRTRIGVDLFTPTEAEEYLNQRLSHDTHLLDGAAELAQALGYLPLALAQAAAYILDQPGLTCENYRRLLSDRAVNLTDLSPEALPDDYGNSVAAAWALSIEAADRHPPHGLASEMLYAASLLDPAGIPVDVLTSNAIRTTLIVRPSAPAMPPSLEVRDITAILARMHRLSLLDFDGQFIRIHALVQRALRDRLSALKHRATSNMVADALLEHWPYPENDSIATAPLRSNTEWLLHNSPTMLFDGNAHPLLFKFGTSLEDGGQLQAAHSYFNRLHTACASTLGPNHPATFHALNHCASTSGESGNIAGAIVVLEKLLAEEYRELGADHLYTFTTRNNLAQLRGESGDAAGAVAAFEELLADEIRTLGPDHLHTFTTRGNLAIWRGYAGDPQGAVSALESLLADELDTLAPDAPSILATRGNLSFWRNRAGDITGTSEALQELLEDQIRVLGSDHPRTLTTRNNLANHRGEAGDAAGAVEALEELLAHGLRVLGRDHPDILSIRNNLSHWRAEAGDAAEALIAFQELLEDQIRILGPDHSRTLTTRNNLAQLRGETGDAAGAIADYEPLLEDWIRVLGRDHPGIRTVVTGLAQWRGETGDAVGAVAALKELLAIQVEALGPDHRRTLTTRHNLEHWRGESGEATGAVAAYEQLTEDWIRTHGPDDPGTLRARNNLAHWCGEAEDYARAATEFADLLQDLIRVFGPDHPDTVHARENLIIRREQAGLT